MNLQERFGAEARNRATGTLSPETVYEAFKKGGAVLGKEQQHLGHPFGAKYCKGAETGDDLALSVCEYGSEDEAKRGREFLIKQFASVPNRQVLINGATTLTVRVGNKTPANEKLAAQFVRTFQELKFAK